MAIAKYLSVKTTLRLLISGLTVFILAHFASCSGDGSTNVEPENFPESNLSYLFHIQPIFFNNCAVSGCHDSVTLAGGLDLQTSTPTFLGNTALTVFPGNAQASLLYEVLFTPVNNLPREPRNAAALTDAQRTAIGTWIDEGANTAN